MHRDIEAIQEKIHIESAFVGRLLDEVGRVIVGQRYMIERLLIGLLADGHVLLEGVPGLAKTMTVRTLANAVSILDQQRYHADKGRQQQTERNVTIEVVEPTPCPRPCLRRTRRGAGRAQNHVVHQRAGQPGRHEP